MFHVKHQELSTSGSGVVPGRTAEYVKRQDDTEQPTDPVDEVPAVVDRAPEPPETAVRLFGDNLDSAIRYADILATTGVRRGLIGPREVPRLWDRHILNCGVLDELVGEGMVVYDVGSG